VAELDDNVAVMNPEDVWLRPPTLFRSPAPDPGKGVPVGVPVGELVADVAVVVVPELEGEVVPLLDEVVVLLGLAVVQSEGWDESDPDPDPSDSDSEEELDEEEEELDDDDDEPEEEEELDDDDELDEEEELDVDVVDESSAQTQVIPVILPTLGSANSAKADGLKSKL